MSESKSDREWRNKETARIESLSEQELDAELADLSSKFDCDEFRERFNRRYRKNLTTKQ